jgi:hypothetical protein
MQCSRASIIIMITIIIIEGFCKFSDALLYFSIYIALQHLTTLIKTKKKFSSYTRKYRVEQLQSHIRGGAS